MQWYKQIKEKTPSCIELEVQKAMAQKQLGVQVLEDGCIIWQGKLYVSKISDL